MTILAGQLIQYFRRQSGLTLEQLSKNICSITYLSQLENNKRLPKEEILLELCARLNLDIKRMYKADSLKLRKDLLSFYHFIQQRNEEEADRMYHLITAAFHSQQQNYHMELYYELFVLNYFLFKKDLPAFQECYTLLDSKLLLMDKEQRYYFETIKGTYALSYSSVKDALTSFHLALSLEGKGKRGDLPYKMAIAYSRLNRLIRSNSCAEDAVALFQEELNYLKVMDCYMILGINFNLLGEYELSASYFQKMIDSPINDLDPSFEGMLYHNYGYLLYNQKKFEEAEIHLKKSLHIRSNSPQACLGSLFLLSKVYMIMNNTEYASISINQGKEIASSENNKEYLLKFNFLSCQFREADQQEIEELLKNHIIPYFERYGDEDDFHYYVKTLADLYYRQHKYKSASDYYKRMIT
ncbi:helix-turn-helix transcriptional regulator [Halobacillus rhizosphaerae]|uniref:helix-turn-helix domain-containing protein n=1 Tax=Halobacillus rhizosphaerae TaxID=3064889 RepID=UPI00398B0CC4